MNDWLAGLTRWLLRILLVLMGLVMFASLLAAAMVLACVWAVRALWARLTGQPAVPWVWRVDPRAGWKAASRYAPRSAPHTGTTDDDTPIAQRGGVLPGAAEVTDVEAREPRS